MLNVVEENFFRRELIIMFEYKLNKKSFIVDYVILCNNRKFFSEICILK